MGSRTVRYRASGGDSELRTYAAEGEGLTIELHAGGSFVVAWSARLPALRFLCVVARFVDANAKMQLSPVDGSSGIPFAEAGEVAIVSSKLDPTALTSLIESTATPCVKQDVGNILASVKRLVASARDGAPTGYTE